MWRFPAILLIGMGIMGTWQVATTQAAPPSASSGDDEWADATADAIAKDKARDNAYTAFKAAEKARDNLLRPAIDKPAPSEQAKTAALAKYDQTAQEVTRRSIEAAQAHNHLAEISARRPAPPTAPTAPTAPGTPGAPASAMSAPPPHSIARLVVNLGSVYHQALKINETLQGPKAIEPGRINKRPDLEEDAFERVVQAYQDRYDNDSLARRTVPSQPTKPTPPTVVQQPPQPPPQQPPQQPPGVNAERARLVAQIAQYQAELERLRGEAKRWGDLTVAAAKRHDQAAARYYSQKHLEVLNQQDDVQFKLDAAQAQRKVLDEMWPK
jgi:hypothetical protein